MMKRVFLAVIFLVSASEANRALAADSSTPNMLSAEEKAAGWKLLFNGKDFSGWHNFKKEASSRVGK